MAARRMDEWDVGTGGAASIAVRHDAFREAYRHSSRVKLMRRMIPVAAAAGVVLVIGVSLVQRFTQFGLPISMAGLSMSGSRIAMESPRLSGFTTDNRPYRVSAQRAEQDIRKLTIVELSGIAAEVGLADGATATLRASRGVMDTQGGQVEMFDRIHVQTTSGYRGQTTHALIDTRAGTLVSNAPVDLSSPNGKMRSDRMQIADRGKTFVFEGNVVGDFMPSAPEIAQPQAAPAVAAVPRTIPAEAPAPSASPDVSLPGASQSTVAPSTVAPSAIPPSAIAPSAAILTTAPLPQPRPLRR